MKAMRLSDSCLRFSILSLLGGGGWENVGGISVLCKDQEKLSEVKDGWITKFASIELVKTPL